MRKLYFIGILISISACGGGGGNDGGSDPQQEVPEVEDCVITMNILNLASGEECNLLQEDADIYGISSGSVACENGVLTYEGNAFSAGTSGIILNGLRFVCGQP